MLLPDSVFNVSAFEEIRRIVLSNQILKFSDHGKPFPGLVTKAKSILLRKKKCDSQTLIRCQTKNDWHQRSHISFSQMPKTRFNFSATEQEVKLVQYLLEQPHTTLAGRATWGMGIVTGNNKKHVHASQEKGLIPVWAGADIRSNCLAAPSRFISDQFQRYQQVAKPELFRADRKLIYKFISSNLVFYCDTEQRFLLNSANFVIPEDDFPVACNVLAEFLNCQLVNWLFRIQFETHKVLKADLGTIPIFHEFLGSRSHFDENSLLDYLNLEVSELGYRVKRSHRIAQ